MLLRMSAYAHLTPLGADRGVLVLHAVTQLRLVLDAEVAGLLEWLTTPREMPRALEEAPVTASREVLAGCLAALMERELVTAESPEEERRRVGERLTALHGRDPLEALDRTRLAAREGADPYWSVAAPLNVSEVAVDAARRVTVLFFGECELQLQADVLRRAARARGLDLVVAAGFPSDARLAEERPHEAVVIGALRSRRLLARSMGLTAGEAAAAYVAEARAVISAIRAASAAPILIDNLPEPTVEPLGFAERGAEGHRNRVRRTNLELAELAAELPDVHVVDVAALLAAHGAARLVDDGLVGFTHFGAPGWMLQRPPAEKAAVFDIFPDVEPLRRRLGNDPYARERLSAEAHLDLLEVVLGRGAKKCVIVDLDGTLWPGVLAETGAPFAWTPEVSGPFSYVGLFFGLHEALKCLKARGVLLACVSKNDAALVRQLWTYPDHYPKDRLLTLEDFVTVRINWRDKAENIAEIAAELGFAEDAFVFIDDHPVERARVREAFPALEVLGEDVFDLRRRLLTHPGLQTLEISEEAARRTDLVRSGLERERLRRDLPDGAAFTAKLNLSCAFEAPTEAAAAARVSELMRRTTQVNTTGLRLSPLEVAARAAVGEVFACRAEDRFGDYGLVAAAVVRGGEIEVFVMSCRVIGLGVEALFLGHIAERLAEEGISELRGRIVATDRNGPVRHLFRDNGFSFDGAVWRRPLARRAA